MPKKNPQGGDLAKLRCKLASRYEVSVSKYKDDYYLHLRDSQKDGKHISLHADGISGLSKVLPKILKAIEVHEDSESEERARKRKFSPVSSSGEESEGEEEPRKKRKRTF